ncbi:MAG TPA: hypothetical protein VF590_11330, partial [Isosphaeraceae bacterium]
MLPGPVFVVEMVTTARRRRYYAIRVLYGTILLLIVWQGYASIFRVVGSGASAPEFSAHQLSTFARDVFLGFAAAQGIALGVLTPTLV